MTIKFTFKFIKIKLESQEKKIIIYILYYKNQTFLYSLECHSLYFL